METELEAAIRSAWAAHERLDWADAIRHWKICTRLDPGLPTAYWMGGSLMLQLGQLDEAEAMLSKGVALDPSNVSLAVKHAESAAVSRHWPEAVRRWNDLAQRAPESEEVQRAIADFSMYAQSCNIDTPAEHDISGIDWSKLAALAKPARDVDLFMQFESLGDNCEFGLVQRHFGAEPLSLLRWNAIGIDKLIDGVEEGFKAAGDMQRTELVIRQHDEYVLLDHSYGMAMHTFVKAAQTETSEQDRMHGKMCRRQVYLATKLKQDLEDATKTFVFKATKGTSLDKVVRLHEAMQRYGTNRLLHVVEAGGDRWAGSVEEVTPRLFVAAIDRFVHNERWDKLSFGGWRDLCRKVAAWESPAPVRHRESATTAEPPPPAFVPPATGNLEEASRPSQATAWDVLAAAHPSTAEAHRAPSWWQRAARRMLGWSR